MKLFPHLIFLCGFLCGIFSRLRIFKTVQNNTFNHLQSKPKSAEFRIFYVLDDYREAVFRLSFFFSYDELSFLQACSFCTSLYQPWLMFYHIFMNQSVEWILTARSNINTVIPKMPKHDLKLRAIKIWGITVQ